MLSASLPQRWLSAHSKSLHLRHASTLSAINRSLHNSKTDRFPSRDRDERRNTRGNGAGRSSHDRRPLRQDRLPFPSDRDDRKSFPGKNSSNSSWSRDEQRPTRENGSGMNRNSRELTFEEKKARGRELRAQDLAARTSRASWNNADKRTVREKEWARRRERAHHEPHHARGQPRNFTRADRDAEIRPRQHRPPQRGEVKATRANSELDDSNNLESDDGLGFRSGPAARSEPPPRDSSRSFAREADDTKRSPRIRRDGFDGDEPNRNRTQNRKDDHERDAGRDAYVSIPYTTAASEFLYGLNVVYAALKARRRKLYKLYIHDRALDNPLKGNELMELAKNARITWSHVGDDFLPVMDKMAGGRPHNGVILETSPLPMLPTTSLGKTNNTSVDIPLELTAQSREDMLINGAPKSLPYPSHTWRKPFVLLLDGILDPGNLGNILRTAYFYGVDAVAICTNTCAPVNATAQKAASGAAEGLTLLSIQYPAAFVSACASNKWNVHAAVAPEASSQARWKKAKGQLFTSGMTSPLSKDPSILMLGAEGEGLRKGLRDKAHSNVAIGGAERGAGGVGVDSLNVGAASAVLIEAFMRKPKNLEDVVDTEKGVGGVGGRMV